MILPVLIYALAACLLLIFPRWHMDDAYISFRYAAHFAAHLGLTFNPGVYPPIEGYTGVLWTVVLGLLIRCGFSPLTTSHVLGIASFLTTIAVLAWMLRRMALDRRAVWLSVLLYVTAPIFYVHAYSGLETSFYILLVLSCFFALWETLRQPPTFGRFVLLCGLLCAAGFTRPEGVFLMALIAASASLFLFRHHRAHLIFFAALAAALILVPQASYLAWKHAYYGQLLPNTFYAKRFNGFLSPEALIGFGKMIVKYFLFPWSMMGLTYALSPGTYAAFLKNTVRRRNHFFWWLSTVALFIAVVFFQYSRSNLQMGLSHRFFAPFFPLMAVGTAFLFEAAFLTWDKWKIESPNIWRHFLFWSVPLLLCQACVLGYAYQKERLYYQTYMNWLNQSHVRAGKLLRVIMPPSAWLATINDTGACPYYAEMPTVDFGRLCDGYLAHHPNLSDAEKAGYFFNLRPAALLITNGRYDMTESSYFSLDPRSQDYDLVQRYGQSLIFPQEFLYLRHDLLKGVCATVLDANLTEEARRDVADLSQDCRAYRNHSTQWPIHLPLHKS